MPRCRTVLFALLALALTACSPPIRNVRSFLDPAYPKVSYNDLKKTTNPLKLKLVVEFQRNGEYFGLAYYELRNISTRVLRASNLITPVIDAGVDNGEIKIVVNDITDRGITEVAKDFSSGVTLGLVGITKADTYVMSVTITTNGKTITRTGIKDAVYTVIGNASTPEGMETMPPNVASERALEAMLLYALQDMQKSGDLAKLGVR